MSTTENLRALGSRVLGFGTYDFWVSWPGFWGLGLTWLLV